MCVRGPYLSPISAGSRAPLPPLSHQSAPGQVCSRLRSPGTPYNILPLNLTAHGSKEASTKQS